jgi:hypothetical protein
MDATQLLDYLTTWSAVRSAREAGHEDLLAAWGDPARARPMRWPISLRIGRL